MGDINFIYHNIYKDDGNRNPKSFIDAYEANSILINNEKLTPDNPNYSKTIQLTADYALMLDSYGSVVKAIPFMDKSIKSYEVWANYINEDVSKMVMYETLVFRRGMANYNQNKHALSTKDFQYLVDTYPDNDKYRNWLVGARTYKTKKYLNTVWGLSVAALVWYVLGTMNQDKHKDYFLMVAIVLVLIGFAMQIMNSIVKSSIEKKSS